MSEARTVDDLPSNRKLAKNTQRGRCLNARDDALTAGILAVGEGDRSFRAERAKQRAVMSG